MSLKDDMLDKKVWAVLGASNNKEKFGYKIYNILKARGYEVYPVNPNYDKIQGDKCYSSLSDLPVVPDVVDFVVPPQVSMMNLDRVKEQGIENVWFQPGTSNTKVVEKAEEYGLNVVENCVLAQLSK